MAINSQCNTFVKNTTQYKWGIVMWNKIVNNEDINDFIKTVSGFHDSCIKEMKYVSGAYVNED